MDYMKDKQSADDKDNFQDDILGNLRNHQENIQERTCENKENICEDIVINLNRYKVFSVDFSGNRIIFETDLDIQKELQGNIFNFTMLSADNAFGSLQIPVKFKRRSSYENTTYIPIPPKMRNDCINKGLFARCYQKDRLIIFEIK